ncbi:MAG: class B sortase [Ruminococcaceae bacterium]|nr:class B sortase [Oscillospiraceae bacterium]
MSNLENRTDKPRKINYFGIAIKLILVAVFIFSVWQVVLYFREGNKEENFNRSLAETVVEEVDPEKEYDYSSDVIENITPFEGFDPDSAQTLIYPDIKVDFKKLKEKYPKAVGWIYSPGTPINYPVMQGKDNAYFVDRLPNGAENAAGSIFMDYRDSADLNDFTHVLYGHNMKNNSMFGTILDYRKDGYFKEHPFMFYFTEDKTYRLELFAGLNTIATSSLYTEPEADKRQAFIDSAFAGSTFSSNVEVTTDDKIIMMSTCSGAVGQINRYVVFAKIVEI